MSQVHALLLTDVVDSTKFAQSLGDVEMARHWLAHDRAARDLLPLWRGREIDKSDGMLLLFAQADDAAAYALAYHRALRRLGLPFKARAGLHVGPVSLRENSPADIALGAKPLEVEGLAKPIVARIMAIAGGGQTLLSAAARSALVAAAPPLQSHGHWRLAGVDEPLEVFEWVDGSAPSTPPVDAAKAYQVVRHGELWLPRREIRHSLPAERDSFVGRHAALLALARKFEHGARLVSVLGIGGAGKTRLALRFAWTWLGAFPGGIWFCDLAQARSLDGILSAVAQGLDLPLGRADPLTQLARAIAGRGKCLVILDNFEQVAGLAEATLGRWLDHAAQARFIVTSRELLGLVGEEALALDPLPPDDAAALFMRRAEALSQGQALLADDRHAIAELVQVLDGLPLAIELAAARVRVMPPRTMLARMNERFSVLLSRAGRRDRQATLRATFDWSWDLLSEPEKCALAQLSVFRGGFTLDAAAAVLALQDAAVGAAVGTDVVLWLVDKSLVRQAEAERFDLLQSLRDYAAEHLRSPGRFAGSGPAALAQAQARHSRYFAALGPQHAVEKACVELDNLFQACQHGIALGDSGVACGALRGAAAAINLRGPFRALVQLSEGVKAMPDLAGIDKLQVTLECGNAQLLAGSTTQAVAEYTSAAAQAQALGEPTLLARAWQGLALLEHRAGHVESAGNLYRRVVDALASGGDPARHCAGLNGLAGVLQSQGRYDEARENFEAGLALARSCGLRRWEGGAAGNLAQFHASHGRPAQALPLYAQAIAIAQEIGDRQWEANTRCNLGLLHFEAGSLGPARNELDAALVLAREVGHLQGLAVVQCNLGLVAEADGQPELAVQHHSAALAVARETGDQRAQGQVLGYLGLLHARQSRAEQARQCLTEGEALLEPFGDPVSLGILLCGRAEADSRSGDADAAAGALARAEALALALPAEELAPTSELGQALRRVRGLIGAVA